MSYSDRYGFDVLASASASSPKVRVVAAESGLVVECAKSGWCGAVVGWQKAPGGWAVILEDRHGVRRPFTLGLSFLIDGQLVDLVRPVADTPSTPRRTASGSVAVQATRARVARSSRIWVEGTQDAALVEKVWGDDLRIEGVVVEYLAGADNLLARVDEVLGASDGTMRIGVLLDHMVAGSKESRIASGAMERWPGQVLAIGHPFVDVWQSIRPATLGIPAWPEVPRGEDWKSGTCRRLGWPDDTGATWRQLLSRVSSYSDLEPELLGRVEELIDFVTG